MRGLIFDIQKFSLHDGPGIRTTVFLKGCPLKCLWCQNPEGLRAYRELQFTAAFCMGCKKCFRVCPQKAHHHINGEHIIDRKKCALCGTCVENCMAMALKIAGREMEVAEVMDCIMQDKAYYDISQGGVTLSGGEPLLQPDFSAALLSACQDKGIHTAVETALISDWKTIEKIIAHTDLLFIDIKVINSKKHRKYTKVSNHRILKNTQRVSKTKIPFAIRTPVVPGLNDTDNDIHELLKFSSSQGNLEYLEFLPFHKLGENKYASIGLKIKTDKISQPSAQRLKRIYKLASKYNIRLKGVPGEVHSS